MTLLWLRTLLLWAAITAALALDCLTPPKNSACVNYKLPAAVAVADLNSLCRDAPWLVGCSLFKACIATKGSPVGASPAVCDPFQQLATICAKDIGTRNLAGCKAHYNSLCAPGSVVKQCQQLPGLSLISTQDANRWVRSICEEMDMDGCARCMPAWKQGKAWGGPVCDVFAVYGWLCVQMPDMWQCIGPGRWDQTCKKDPKLYACVGNAAALTDKGWGRG